MTRCTGLTAVWCPVHGDCRCREREQGNYNDRDCPLHAPGSSHGDDYLDAREPLHSGANALLELRAWIEKHFLALGRQDILDRIDVMLRRGP